MNKIPEKSFAVNKKNTATIFLIWHFYEAPKFLFSVWINYIKFVFNYFSIYLLFLTLFYPWRRYKWNYPRGFDLGGYFSVFISNSFSRAMGAIARSMLIITGIVVQIFVLAAGSILILSWIIMPFAILSLLILLLYV